MEPKKNPKADLRKNSVLYFQIGLILILFLTWQAIEMKTYPDEIDIGQVQVDDLLDEDVPITEIQNTPPPPPISSHLSAPESSISLDTRSACGL